MKNRHTDNHEERRARGATKPFLMGAVCMYALLLTCFEAGRINGNVWASRQPIQEVTLQQVEPARVAQATPRNAKGIFPTALAELPE